MENYDNGNAKYPVNGRSHLFVPLPVIILVLWRHRVLIKEKTTICTATQRTAHNLGTHRTRHRWQSTACRLYFLDTLS